MKKPKKRTARDDDEPEPPWLSEARAQARYVVIVALPPWWTWAVADLTIRAAAHHF
jgi:hypothetical protein